MMIYQKLPPSSFLEPFVKTFYVWESTNPGLIPLSVESPPSGYTSIVFNYSDSYNIVNDKYLNQTAPVSFISGQSTKRYELRLEGKIGMIGVVFKPAALHTIFGFPMYEFSDERFNLPDVLGREAVILNDKIFGAKNNAERITILDRFLSQKIVSSKKSFDRTDYIANLILEKPGLLSIQNLTNELYVCPRQFQRQFLNKVGVSAKYYSRISRISSLCAFMARKKWDVRDWHQLIYSYGYYDQSHFIREFTEFMGKAPSSYIKSNIELANYVQSTRAQG